MRDGFLDIVSGWTIVDDFDDLTERIERAAEWTKANGPLEADEEATVKLMIEAQVARGIRRGDFEPYIGRDAAWPLEPPDDAAETPNLGACCICERDDGPITTIIMLDVKGQVPGHGWGCVACNLPADGASAVLCRCCTKDYEFGKAKLKFACRGWPAHDGRVPIGELTVPHAHDATIDHDA